MNANASQPPPLPCSTCGGTVAEYGAYRYRCESCKGIRPRTPDAIEAACLFRLRVCCVVFAVAPLFFVWKAQLELGPFVVMNLVCSLLAGAGMMARTADWKTTVFTGLGLGITMCCATTLVGGFIGCLRDWP